MTGKISLHYEDEDCDEVIEQSFDSDCRAQNSRSADAAETGTRMTVELHLGDCLEVMRGMADKSVDAVITDPPYGIGLDYASYDDSDSNLSSLIDSFVPECRRIAKKVAITCGVANIHRYPKPDWTLCWFWTNTTSTGKWGFNCWQPILVYGKDPQLEARKGRHQDARQFNPNEGKIGSFNHPCPKPISVMKWLVERCSLDSWTILDPFMGSGTTGVACVQTGRNFIGIEIDEGYFDIACKRISDALKQPLLPFTEGKDDRQN